MRVYHFLSVKNALDDLAKRRIKISEIDTLNDPFELWCVAQGDSRIRQGLRKFKLEVAQRFGMLCFCEDWHNPVLWSHYADRHRGMCLGFEAQPQLLNPINYVTERSPLRPPLTLETAKMLLYTKYKDWSYEREVRGWFSLEERDGPTGLYFYPFDEKLRLAEVIAGPLCDLGKRAIEAALTGYTDAIEITQARLAFEMFRVVRNKKGFAVRG